MADFLCDSSVPSVLLLTTSFAQAAGNSSAPLTHPLGNGGGCLGNVALKLSIPCPPNRDRTHHHHHSPLRLECVKSCCFKVIFEDAHSYRVLDAHYVIKPT